MNAPRSAARVLSSHDLFPGIPWLQRPRGPWTGKNRLRGRPVPCSYLAGDEASAAEQKSTKACNPSAASRCAPSSAMR